MSGYVINLQLKQFYRPQTNTSMKTKFVLLSSFVIITLTSYGQNAGNQPIISNNKHEHVLFDITLDGDSHHEEGFVDVKRKTKSIFIDVKGSLKDGRFKIQIYDPKGKQWKKDYIVDSQYDGEVFEFTNKRYIPVPDSILNSKQPVLLGRVGIAINRPKSGQWNVKLISEKATGTVNVSYYFGQ